MGRQKSYTSIVHTPFSPTSSASRSGCSETSSATAPPPCVGSPAVFSPYRAMSEHTTMATLPAPAPEAIHSAAAISPAVPP